MKLSWQFIHLPCLALNTQPPCQETVSLNMQKKKIENRKNVIKEKLWLTLDLYQQSPELWCRGPLLSVCIRVTDWWLPEPHLKRAGPVAGARASDDVSSWRLRLDRAPEGDWWPGTAKSVRLRHRQRSDWAVAETAGAGGDWGARREDTRPGAREWPVPAPAPHSWPRPAQLSLGHDSWCAQAASPNRQSRSPQLSEESQPRGQAPVTEDTAINAQSWTPSERASEPDTSSAGWCRKVVRVAITPCESHVSCLGHSLSYLEIFGFGNDDIYEKALVWAYHHSEAVRTLLETLSQPMKWKCSFTLSEIQFR